MKVSGTFASVPGLASTLGYRSRAGFEEARKVKKVA